VGFGEAISCMIFMGLGLFGISVQLKEMNLFLLIGSIGIIMVVITQITKDYIKSNQSD